MAQFLNSINEVRKNYTKYDTWEQTQADERAKKEYLTSIINIPKDKLELTEKQAKAVIRATEVLDKRSEDNCENMEQLTGMVTGIPLGIIALGAPPLIEKYFSQIIKNTNKKINDLSNVIADESLSSEIKETTLNELGRLTKKVRDLGLKKGWYSQLLSVPVMLIFASAAVLWGTSKQKNASRIGRLQAKNNELQNVKNFVIYTPEQLEQAQNLAENIKDEKERGGIRKIITELNEVRKDGKAYKKWLKGKDTQEIEKLKAMKYTPEQIKVGEEYKELIVDTVKEINIKAEEYSENVENAFDTMTSLSWLAAAPIGFAINKILKFLKVPSKINAAISIALPTLTSTVIGIAGTIEQKKAAGVGRYQARKDLMKNPARLMYFSKDEMDNAKDIKADKQKQKFWVRISNSFTFIKKYFEDTKEYHKYKKEEYVQAEKLQKALNQLEISEKQKKDAEQLQKNVFRAFDEVDEMSQRYSEDIEAGCNILKQIVGNVWSVGSTVAMLGGMTAFSKGKFPVAKTVNTIVNIGFKKESSIRKGINSIYSVLRKDKKLMHKFQLAISRGNLEYFLSKPEAEEVSDVVSQFILNNSSVFTELKNSKSRTALIEYIKPQLKDGFFAKWVRNLFNEGTNLYKKVKFGDEIPAAIQEGTGMNGWKNYKTLIGTGTVAATPVLGILIGAPYAFYAWLTDIQKKSGKIGIMKAMEKIDDPRVFAPQEPVEVKEPSTTEIKSTNLLKAHILSSQSSQPK